MASLTFLTLTWPIPVLSTFHVESQYSKYMSICLLSLVDSQRKIPSRFEGISFEVVPVAGIEPAWIIRPRDFESRASTNSTTRARDEL